MSFFQTADHTSDLAINLVGVSASYDGSPVLDNISLQVPRGAFVGVVGPSGAGKTTLLRVVLGSLPQAVGHVEVFGQRIGGPNAPAIGYVPQLETVDWNFPVTVREVVAMGLAARPLLTVPWLTRNQRARIDAVLERLGVGELGNRHIRELSGGQQQRVFLARALVRQPPLLVLDEPTSGVDIQTRHEVLHLLAELNHEGVTVLLTTHDLNSVATHLPRVVCLNRRVIAYGPPSLVFDPAVLKETYGADMIIVHQGDLTLIADRVGVFRDIPDQHSHVEGADHHHVREPVS